MQSGKVSEGEVGIMRKVSGTEEECPRQRSEQGQRPHGATVWLESPDHVEGGMEDDHFILRASSPVVCLPLPSPQLVGGCLV